MEGLKITFVYDVVYPWVKGGVEKRIYELAVRLAKSHEVHVYGYRHWEGSAEIERDGIYYHGTVRVGKLYVGSRRSIIPPMRHAVSLLSQLKGERFDVIDCQASPYLPAYSLRTLGLENVFITWHEFWGDYWFEYLGEAGFLGKTLEKGLFSFERHISVSQKTRLDLLSAGLRRPVFLVPNGVDYGFIRSVRPSELESDFVFIGRLIPEKGVDFLLRSLALLKREFPDFRGIIAGDGPERKKLEFLARELGIEKNVTFTGFLRDYADVIALMKASKVFAFPSRREGFGIVVIEAMASEVPVVTGEHPMNASVHLVEDGKTGFVVPLDEELFARALLLAYDNSKKLGSVAGERARRYDWDEVVRVLLSVYRGG
ncbi:glycosyltransferase family 4 protein [Thermococcus radiotolerans]|uniref:Glycosyl transferase family 1 n=1 Tax=Thermococcus radiotolerans TaxID=187880 RepID=A0A2Z2N154_9EURY|nr:glycosyltransferase family 4 protein [Thermococcus radiotolerans]ASJ15224.1 glycosyl transferase family 1 [Thermococcus radiotolerans]